MLNSMFNVVQFEQNLECFSYFLIYCDLVKIVVLKGPFWAKIIFFWREESYKIEQPYSVAVILEGFTIYMRRGHVALIKLS